MVTESDIERLREHTETPSVSLFLPLHAESRDARQDRIRLRNLLDEAERRIAELRLGDPGPVLQWGRDLLGDEEPRQFGGQGLAVFLGLGWHQVVHTPFSLPERVVVGRRPHLRPLLAGLQRDQRFYVLALSRQKVRLFEASRFTMQPVDLGNVPAGLEETLRNVELERGQDMYRGHGGNREIEDERVLEYFRAVDSHVAGKLDGRAPLVLAGVEDLHPLYRRVTAYGNVLPAGVTGNRDAVGVGELHDEAWHLVEPLARDRLGADLAACGELLAKKRAVKGPASVLMAALQGRVETLFIAEDGWRWGAFSRDTGKLRPHERHKAGDEELLDLAAAMTLGTSGRVWVLPVEQLGDMGEIVAVKRF